MSVAPIHVGFRRAWSSSASVGSSVRACRAAARRTPRTKRCSSSPLPCDTRITENNSEKRRRGRPRTVPELPPSAGALLSQLGRVGRTCRSRDNYFYAALALRVLNDVRSAKGVPKDASFAHVADVDNPKRPKAFKWVVLAALGRLGHLDVGQMVKAAKIICDRRASTADAVAYCRKVARTLP